MSAIIRLARRGKKGQPYYHIVVADKRFARDARFIEKIGTYNPGTNPVTVDIKFDRAVQWIQNGAKPSDTTRSILSDNGVLLRAHLQKGVTKGALTQEQADAKFTKWENDRKGDIEKQIVAGESARKQAYEKRMAGETATRQSRTAKRKEAEAAKAAETAQAEATATAEAATAEAAAPAEEPKPEAGTEEAK